MEPIDLVYEICRHYVNDLDDVSPALKVVLDGYRRARNLAGLASCSSLFDLAKHTVKDWAALRQVEAFFKKNSLFSSPAVCQEQAKRTFVDAEAKCSDTNVRLRKYTVNPHLLGDDYRTYVLRMKRYVNNVLGDISVFLDELPHLVRVTPGATAHSSRRESLPQMKMRLRFYATRRASKYARAVYHYYGFPNPRIKNCYSNRVELVPKNWKTDRTIACEPEGNLPFQLAFDTYAKRRLRRYGIDLRDQSASRELAKHASINGDFVTVDFSSASDTIAFNTVQMVFPSLWFEYLDDVRTPGYRGVFGEGVYSKFSSMGNGSTFCIETLLFAAACYAVGSKGFLVYGDDVIIEKELYEPFLALTSFLGFSINVDKTFATGPFRESCGGDYYNGIDVTPTYIRNIDTRKAAMCHLVNTLKCISRFDGALEGFLDNLIKEYKLPLVPFNENTMSGVWIDPYIARTKKILTRYHKRFHGIDSYLAYVPTYKKKSFVDSRGYYLWFLNKNSQVLFSGPWALATSMRVERTSSVAVFDHSYVRKRVCWREPATGAPDYLYR